MNRPAQLPTRLALCLWLAPALAVATIHHEIEATIDPAAGRLEVRDRLTLPVDRPSWTFLLHEDLRPEVAEGAARLTPLGHTHHLARWRLDRTDTAAVTLRYAGVIRHDLAAIPEGMGRTRHWSPGLIAADGVFLGGQSGWHPLAAEGTGQDRGLLTFGLHVTLPEGWLAVSQGAGPEIRKGPDSVQVGWQEASPQDEIHLIAAPFERYRRATPLAEAQVYLRTPDAALARRYLEATADYLALYDRLIGPYPYAKFALVENFWETGYGMPSFTLLGPQVIRLPFILQTSYPHEILHNWWGNGVYVDYDSGNWSEGLTTYLADHLLREQAGHGAEYRRDALKAYEDYVRTDHDFPLRDFRARHSSASQAVGYGKAMMVMHMLRRELGDDVFIAGLQGFYADNRFRTASFADLRRAFETASGRDLEGFFATWTERTGAPRLRLTGVEVHGDSTGLRVRGRLTQTQEARPFPLRVPLLIHTGPDRVTTAEVAMTGRQADFDIAVPERPVRIAVDPQLDLFRHLVPGESPVTLSRLLGADQGLILLPADAPDTLATAYRRLAETWRVGQPGWSVSSDQALTTLPTDRPVWLLGWENRFLGEFAATAPDLGLDRDRRRLALATDGPPAEVASGDDGVVLSRARGEQALGWLAAGDAETIAGLARKVPHYGKYSYLTFAAGTAENRLKGQWPIAETDLMAWLGDGRPRLALPERPPLVAR